MYEYFTHTLTTVNKIRIHGEKIQDLAIFDKILRSMSPKFDYMVCSIEESHDLDTLSINELQSNLLVHEQRMTSHVMKEHALKITHRATTICVEKRCCFLILMKVLENLESWETIQGCLW